MNRALKICQKSKPRLSEISVNSSQYAVPIYEKLGFRQIADMQVRNGIGFIPMVLKLSIQQGDREQLLVSRCKNIYVERAGEAS